MLHHNPKSYTIIISDVEPSRKAGLINCLMQAPEPYNLLSTQAGKLHTTLQRVKPDLMITSEQCLIKYFSKKGHNILPDIPLLVIRANENRVPTKVLLSYHPKLDYIPQPIDCEELQVRLRYGLQRETLAQQVLQLQTNLDAQKQQQTNEQDQEQVKQSLQVQQKNQLLLKVLGILRGAQTSGRQLQPKELQQIIRNITSHLQSADDWAMFQANFNKVHPNFLKKLQQAHPQLNPDDLKHCACIKLGFNNKEIAQMFNINPRSVVMYHYRLKKKMQIKGADTLSDYLRQLPVIV